MSWLIKATIGIGFNKQLINQIVDILFKKFEQTALDQVENGFGNDLISIDSMVSVAYCGVLIQNKKNEEIPVTVFLEIKPQFSNSKKESYQASFGKGFNNLYIITIKVMANWTWNNIANGDLTTSIKNNLGNMLAHELSHSRDPHVFEMFQTGKIVRYDNTSYQSLQKYINSEPEIKAYLSQILYELRNFKYHDFTGKNIIQFLGDTSRTFVEIARFLNPQTKKYMLTRIYNFLINKQQPQDDESNVILS